jgi:hypothetical protein
MYTSTIYRLRPHFIRPQEILDGRIKSTPSQLVPSGTIGAGGDLHQQPTAFNHLKVIRYLRWAKPLLYRAGITEELVDAGLVKLDGANAVAGYRRCQKDAHLGPRAKGAQSPVISTPRQGEARISRAGVCESFLSCAARDADDNGTYRLDSCYGLARDDRPPSVFTMAQPQCAGSLKMALCRAEITALGRICRLQLAIGKFGNRRYECSDAVHRAVGAMDLYQ